MFLKENFEVLESQTSGMNTEQINAYLKGAKDAMAFVNLWIDSLNTLELESSDITKQRIFRKDLRKNANVKGVRG